MADDQAPEKALYEVPHRNTTMIVKLTAEEAEELYGDTATRVGAVRKAEPQPIGEPPYAAPVPPEGESTVGEKADDDDASSATASAPKRRTAANKARPAGGDK